MVANGAADTDGGVAGTFSGTASVVTGGGGDGGFGANASVAVRLNTSKQHVRRDDRGRRPDDRPEVRRRPGPQAPTARPTSPSRARAASGSATSIDVEGMLANDGHQRAVRHGSRSSSARARPRSTTARQPDRDRHPDHRARPSRCTTLAGGKTAFYATGTLQLIGIPGVTLAAQSITLSYNDSTGEETFTHVGGQKVAGERHQARGLGGQPHGVLRGLHALRRHHVQEHRRRAASRSASTTSSSCSARATRTPRRSRSPRSPARSSRARAASPASSTASVKLRFGDAPVDVTSGVALRINTTSTDVAGTAPFTDAIPAGSVQVSLNQLSLTLAGQTLKGDFTFEQITTPATPPATPEQGRARRREERRAVHRRPRDRRGREADRRHGAVRDARQRPRRHGQRQRHGARPGQRREDHRHVPRRGQHDRRGGLRAARPSAARPSA